MSKSELYGKMEDLIVGGRENIDGECRRLMEQDLLAVLQEYFDLREPPKIQIKNKENGFDVAISFSADYIRACKGLNN